MKVIYIAGLYHTGSTLMDLTLGNLPNVIGLGEIYKGLVSGFEKKCSCGKDIGDCSFWGEVNNKLIENSNLDIQEKYNLVISNFQDNFGGDFILVDSSKCHPFDIFPNKFARSMQGLDYLIKIENIDLKVIHMVRDVRSWSNGLLMRDERTKADLNHATRLYRKFSRSASARLQSFISG